MLARRSFVLSFVSMMAVAGCSAESEVEPRSRVHPWLLPGGPAQIPAPVEATCEVSVDGVGVLDMETEYLPNVVFCENGLADLEALKVQAIAARSAAYHTIATHGSICNSQDCQVYSCDYGEPSAIHYQAVEETSGMILAYDDLLTYGFYVAGDPDPNSATCVGAPGSADTEHYVTYNDGLESTAVEQTSLGFIFPVGDPGYGTNRGCMAQVGSQCLEEELGYDYVDILRFYYGSDIEIVTTQGACVLDPDPTGGDSSGGDDGPADTGADTGGDESGDLDDTGDDGGDDTGDDAGAGDDDAVGDDDDAEGTDGMGQTSVDPALPPTAGFDEGDEDTGCACRADRPTNASWLWLGLLPLVVRRRCAS